MKNSIPYLFLFTVLTALLVMTTGCQDGAGRVNADYQQQQASFLEENIHSGITTSQLNRLVDGNSRFAVDFYKELLKDHDGNIICSPLSASIALAMAYAGSEGVTRTEMEDVLNFDLRGETTHAGFTSISNVLNSAGDAGSFKLHSANSLWLQEGDALSDNFSRITDTYYSGSLDFVDFHNEPLEACDIINEWVEGKTNNKIKNLMTPDMIDNATRLAIVNAVYFMADWLSKFDEDETDDKLFNTLDEGVRRYVTMMEQEGELPYTEGENYQALRLEYEGSLASMIVILPELDDFLDFEQSLDMDILNEIMTSFEEEHLKVYLPSFEFETDLPLSDTLIRMGMPNAFSEGFDPMFKNNPLGATFIQTVKQKAFIALDEEGTEATASTVILMAGIGGGPPPEIDPPLVFRADHPFIFLIVEHSTNTILFMGRVLNPSQS